MLRIRNLHSVPAYFKPIIFQDGLNLILGEKNETSEKTNGVGKSLSIEFINFCLLKEFSKSRLFLIPESDFPRSTTICLDIEINGKPLTIKRSMNDHNRPTIISPNSTIIYDSLQDATLHLTNLLFGSAHHIPSFRSLLGPLMRDERSEFKSIIDCFDTKLKIPSDYAPHLYLLGVPPYLYIEAKRLQVEIDSINTARTKLKKDIELFSGRSLSDAKADLNDLTAQVERIKKTMDSLETAESYELIKDELIELEIKISDERAKIAISKSELSKIKHFKGDNFINEEEISDLYNRFKSGLGDLIKHELKEVMSFKSSIDNFQKSLLEARRDMLLKDIRRMQQQLQALDFLYKTKLQIIDQNGALKPLKTTILAYQNKLNECSKLSSLISKHDEYDTETKRIKLERSGKIILLESLIKEAKVTIDSLQESILEIHEYVMGNRKCFFEITINDNKQIVKYELRIYDDGSHSNEREKVFFYDISLLINNKTSSNHPGILIHDNIFDVDQDSLIKSLNYLAQKEADISQKQYILTLNTDKFHDDDLDKLSLDIEACSVAKFTKENRFLGIHYQEKSH